MLIKIKIDFCFHLYYYVFFFNFILQLEFILIGFFMRIILSHYSDCEFAMQTHISLRLLHHFISFCFYVKFDTHFFYPFLNWFFFQFYPSILNWLRIRFHNVFRWCDPDIMIRVMCIKCFYLFFYEDDPTLQPGSWVSHTNLVWFRVFFVFFIILSFYVGLF